MISPSATSPGLSTAEDDGLFFRTGSFGCTRRSGDDRSDHGTRHQIRGAEPIPTTIMARVWPTASKSSFEAAGGTVTINISHEDGKADYSSEVATLASAGGDILVVAGYLDQGGRGIIEGALDTGAWDRFVLPGGMIGDNILSIGDDLKRFVRSGCGYRQPWCFHFCRSGKGCRVRRHVALCTGILRCRGSDHAGHAGRRIV